jgi:DNA polymerase II large subunit
MNMQSFEIFSRRAAKAITRRTSLAPLGAAGLAAITHVTTADAKNKNNDKKKNRADKKAKKECQAQLAQCATQSTQCASQVDACTTVLTGRCQGDPDCLALIACCPILGTCDASAFLACASS